ncbi:S41 family peptidase [[Bacteroides] pectinophilus]|jgi:carboxyl-terminal processing protease|uniref:PDZ domain-containing protein n=1 Tax=[Bacteroides] pectinophilus ATCC 43243 TaxID=483218 RepID=B7AVS8_9FIRM|nr:peptidase, S41 family [[Bacteroides] pectinophilus ATCC 43243]UWN96197.1 S41 family peptidase [[Bacteroides] pectinophilus]
MDNFDNDNNVNEKNVIQKERHRSGVIQGLLIGSFTMLAICAVVIAAAVKKGYIRPDTDGSIYIQSETYDGNTGIGTEAEQKLNLIDQTLKDFYFDDIDDSKVLDNIYKAYVNAYGDKYTVYYTADEYAKIQESSNGAYYGIGVVVRKNDDGTILVVEPYDGAPGKEAGMRKNDVIVTVNGESVADQDLNSVVAKIKGDEGTTVNIGIRRDGSDDIAELTVTRRKVEIKTVAYEMLDDSVGLITISEFDKVTAQQFKEAYAQLETLGMKGLVIDIRSNPGGLLNVVVDMLDEILPDGLIVYTEDKYGNRQEYNGSNPDVIDVPLAVLVNGESASASEIFAGAVQDYGAGTIIGTQTFGKGIVQTIRRMSDGSAIKYTMAKYFTPKGQDIHGHGVTPDIVEELSDEFNNLTEYDASKDNQLQKAIEVIKGDITR